MTVLVDLDVHFKAAQNRSSKILLALTSGKCVCLSIKDNYLKLLHLFKIN